MSNWYKFYTCCNSVLDIYVYCKDFLAAQKNEIVLQSF